MISEPFLQIKKPNSCSTTVLFWNQTEEKGYKKNQKFLQDYKDGLYIRNPIEYTVNRFGYRSKYSDIPNTDYILVLGCSHTFGSGLHEEHRYSNLLEDYYNVPVINVGFPGGSPNLVRDNIFQLFVSGRKMPKLVIIQWPNTIRLTFNHTTLGPWTIRRKENKLFANSIECIDAFSKIAKHQVDKLLEKLDIPCVDFSLRGPNSDIVKTDVARDRDHGGIETNKKIFEHIVEKIETSPNIKKLFCYQIKRRYTTRRRVYHCKNYIYKEWIKDIRKIWTYPNLLNKIALIQKIDPTYILDHGEDEEYVWAKMRLIKGGSVFKKQWNEIFVKKVIDFIINHYKTFYPIYHGDPSLSNIIILDSGEFQYIDYDDIAVCENKKEVLAHIQKKCIESFSQKVVDFDVVQIIKDRCNDY